MSTSTDKFIEDCLARVGIPKGYTPTVLSIEYVALVRLLQSLALPWELGTNLLDNPTRKDAEREALIEDIRTIAFKAFLEAAQDALKLDVSEIADRMERKKADEVERVIAEAQATLATRKRAHG